jgi:hypothetical protein
MKRLEFLYPSVEILREESAGMDGGTPAKFAQIHIPTPFSRDDYGSIEDVFSVVMAIVVSYPIQKRGRRLAYTI